MKKINDYAFSKFVNNFIEKLKKHQDTIEVISNELETIILYEDYEHEPIKNFRNSFNKEFKFSEESRKRMSEVRRTRICSEETKKRISKANKGRKASELTKTKLSMCRKKYYDDLKNKKNAP